MSGLKQTLKRCLPIIHEDYQTINHWQPATKPEWGSRFMFQVSDAPQLDACQIKSCQSGNSATPCFVPGVCVNVFQLVLNLLRRNDIVHIGVCPCSFILPSYSFWRCISKYLTFLPQNGKNKLAVRKVCQWENLFNLAHKNLSWHPMSGTRQHGDSSSPRSLYEAFAKPRD